LKKELDIIQQIPDDKSSKMSIWAKASAALDPFKSKHEKEKEDHQVEEIIEIKESKLGSST